MGSRRPEDVGTIKRGKIMPQTEKNRKQRMTWFRFYTDAVNDPKVQRLSPQLFKTWVNILCLAGQNEGKLPSIDDIAFQLRISAHEAQQQFDDLVLAGLVDILPDKSREPHNWKSRQFKSDTSAERTRKYREKKEKQACDVTSDVTVTAPDTETDTETDNTPKPPRGDPLPVQEAYELWNATALACGLTQGKLTPARRKAIGARLRENDGLTGWKQMLAGIERSSFLTGGQPGRNGGQSFRADLDFVLKPAKFQKILEGGYGNGRHAGPHAKPKQPAYLSRY